MSANAPSSWQPNQTPPKPDLPPVGVAFGMLWVAGAFAALFGCFINNHRNTPPVPSDELAISNAAMGGGEHAPAEHPQP